MATEVVSTTTQSTSSGSSSLHTQHLSGSGLNKQGSLLLQRQDRGSIFSSESTATTGSFPAYQPLSHWASIKNVPAFQSITPIALLYELEEIMDRCGIDDYLYLNSALRTLQQDELVSECANLIALCFQAHHTLQVAGKLGGRTGVTPVAKELNAREAAQPEAATDAIRPLNVSVVPSPVETPSPLDDTRRGSVFGNIPIFDALEKWRDNRDAPQPPEWSGRTGSRMAYGRRSRFGRKVSRFVDSRLASIVSMESVQSVKETGATYDEDMIGNVTINGYVILDDLGQGASGKVKLAIHSTSCKSVAIKFIPCKFNFERLKDQAVRQEIAVMKKLRHRNIVSLYEVISDEEHQQLLLVLQYIPNGPVLSFDGKLQCNRLRIETAQWYMRQLLGGLSYLHQRNIAHGDIKPDNILLGADRTTVYLADFGCSVIGEASDRVSVGTPLFFAPEMCRTSVDFEEGKVDTKPRDVWALGIVLFCMVHGRFPFRGTQIGALMREIGSQPVDIPPDTPEQCRDMLTRMLDRDPNKRWSVTQLRYHPFIVSAHSGGGSSLEANTAGVDFNGSLSMNDANDCFDDDSPVICIDDAEIDSATSAMETGMCDTTLIQMTLRSMGMPALLSANSQRAMRYGSPDSSEDSPKRSPSQRRYVRAPSGYNLPVVPDLETKETRSPKPPPVSPHGSRGRNVLNNNDSSSVAMLQPHPPSDTPERGVPQVEPVDRAISRSPSTKMARSPKRKVNIELDANSVGQVEVLAHDVGATIEIQDTPPQRELTLPPSPTAGQPKELALKLPEIPSSPASPNNNRGTLPSISTRAPQRFPRQ